MSHAFRLVAAAAAVMCMVGCYSVPAPQDALPDTFPASGPTGMRIGVAYQKNTASKEIPAGPSGVMTPYNVLAGKDGTDMWDRGMGGTFEVPIDYNPFWGGFVGVGYDRMDGRSIEGHEVGDLNLVPMYAGLTARLPFWLDWDAWDKLEDPVWLPNVPNGPAVYVRALGGAAYTLKVPMIYAQAGGGGPRTRVLDYQAAPFYEGSGGVEYRFKDIGVWAEIGYRYYFLEGGRPAYNVDGLGGPRVTVGLSWYGF